MIRNLRRSVSSVRLFVESLESRESPSSMSDPESQMFSYPAYAYTQQADDPAPAPAAEDGEPIITDARGTSGPSGSVTVSGKAIDDKSLAGCLVLIRGNGVSETVIVDKNGQFSIAFQRPVNGDFVVEVTVIDSDANVSAPVTVLVSGI